MNRLPRVARHLGLAALLIGGLHGCRTNETGAAPPPSRAESFFVSAVKPIFERNCLECHNGKVLPGRMDLSNRSKAFAGKSGPRRFLVAGRPEQSLLLLAVARPGNHPKMMPQRDLSLTEDDIGTLREWIADGAAWPSGPSGELRPVANPEVR